MDSTARRELLQKLAQSLGTSGKTAKDLVKELDNVNKSDVNSVLYAGLNCGLFERTEHEKDDGTKGAPTWALTFTGQLVLGPENDLVL